MKLVLLALSLMVVSAAVAQQGAPTGSPGAVTPATSATRDPFWPVGYTPKESTQPDAAPVMPGITITEDDWRQAQKRLVAASIFRSKSTAGVDRFLALINGQVVSAGDAVAVQHRGFTFRFKVTNITSAGPQFERVETK